MEDTIKMLPNDKIADGVMHDSANEPPTQHKICVIAKLLNYTS